jgi:hypothetical protein
MWELSHGMYLMRGGMQWLVELVPYLILACNSFCNLDTTKGKAFIHHSQFTILFILLVNSFVSRVYFLCVFSSSSYTQYLDKTVQHTHTHTIFQPTVSTPV